MFQLFLRARAHNYLRARAGDQDFRARSAERDAETDRSRVGSIMTAIEAALHAAENEQSGLNRRVEDVLARPMEDRAGRDGSRIALGQTEAGRYMRVIYVPDPAPGSVFVITAYELGEKARKALRRRQKSAKRKKP